MSTKKQTMFAGSNSKGGGRAGRVISALIETSGMVCGSIKDTLDEKEIDMKWVESEINSIGSKMEKPKQQIYNLADRACRHGETLSPVAGASSANVGNTLMMHMPDNSFLVDDETTANGDLTEDDHTVFTNASTSLENERTESRFASVIREQQRMKNAEIEAAKLAADQITVVIGLCLSRNNATVGHPDTVSRQTAFDFNELQDRDYKYVSSTDDSGWLAGGGERGDPYLSGVPSEFSTTIPSSASDVSGQPTRTFGSGHKIAAPDRVHIPIIKIIASNASVVEEIVSSLARGEIFIPEMSVTPETLTVNSTSPPDLVVRFGCEKNDDANPEEWSNWCLEFLHNQLYDYFSPVGAQWSRRPFQITLARKVKWATVKHMNKYFANAQSVIDSWREKGPQKLQPPYADEGSRGVILEEITRPHGIYLLQDGVPTNYFAPNFPPPYTTKMRRSLINNVISKSWDKQHRDWLSDPLPKRKNPVELITSVMGCANSMGHLSPSVYDAKFAENIGALHIRSDFDLVQDAKNRDLLNAMPSSPEEDRRGGEEEEQGYHPEERAASPQRRATTGRQLDARPTNSIPSDESYGNNQTREESLSLDGSLTDTVDGPIVTGENDTSNGFSGSQVISPDPDGKQFFSNKSATRSSSFGSSSKGVSFSEGSFAEGERDRHSDRRQRTRASELSRPKDPYMDKLSDSRSERRAKAKRREMRDRRNDENASSPSRNPQCNSPESMAYSMDSASFFGRQQQPQHMAQIATNTDQGSVFTSATEKESLLSYVTRSTVAQSQKYQQEYEGNDVGDEASEDESLSLLLRESQSSIVPSDEDLMAIGWGKALDSNSGAYYYFTLDRAKTVWENPLSPTKHQ
mmetsp:Transcript_30379/g.69302  ORF Transcript_30379/g.69302 Transcript_30379/m.69302 type:complete len:861 (+) Transcript_30379:240-2822(+)